MSSSSAPADTPASTAPPSKQAGVAEFEMPPPVTNSTPHCASIFKISRTTPAHLRPKNWTIVQKKLPNESGSGLAGVQTTSSPMDTPNNSPGSKSKSASKIPKIASPIPRDKIHNFRNLDVQRKLEGRPPSRPNLARAKVAWPSRPCRHWRRKEVAGNAW